MEGKGDTYMKEFFPIVQKKSKAYIVIELSDN